MILAKLFFAFIQVGLFSIGGGYAAIPLIQSQVVDTYSLMTQEEFTDLITIAEMTPGPISINSATFVGTGLAGPLGAVICTLGCILPSFIICYILARLYYKYRTFGGIQRILGALRPAVAALVASAGATILILGIFGSDIREISLSQFRPTEFIVFTAAIIILRKYKISPAAVILGSGAAGAAVYAAAQALSGLL